MATTELSRCVSRKDRESYRREIPPLEPLTIEGLKEDKAFGKLVSQNAQGAVQWKDKPSEYG